MDNGKDRSYQEMPSAPYPYYTYILPQGVPNFTIPAANIPSNGVLNEENKGRILAHPPFPGIDGRNVVVPSPSPPVIPTPSLTENGRTIKAGQSSQSNAFLSSLKNCIVDGHLDRIAVGQLISMHIGRTNFVNDLSKFIELVHPLVKGVLLTENVFMPCNAEYVAYGNSLWANISARRQCMRSICSRETHKFGTGAEANVLKLTDSYKIPDVGQPFKCNTNWIENGYTENLRTRQATNVRLGHFLFYCLSNCCEPCNAIQQYTIRDACMSDNMRTADGLYILPSPIVDSLRDMSLDYLSLSNELFHPDVILNDELKKSGPFIALGASEKKRIEVFESKRTDRNLFMSRIFMQELKNALSEVRKADVYVDPNNGRAIWKKRSRKGKKTDNFIEQGENAGENEIGQEEDDTLMDMETDEIETSDK